MGSLEYSIILYEDVSIFCTSAYILMETENCTTTSVINIRQKISSSLLKFELFLNPTAKAAVAVPNMTQIVSSLIPIHLLVII